MDEVFKQQLQQLNFEIMEKEKYLRELESKVDNETDDKCLAKLTDRLNQFHENLKLLLSERRNLTEKWLGAAAGPGPGTAGADAPRLYNNVTVFLPDGSGYIKRDYRKLTSAQFQQKMRSESYRRVVPVDEQPPQLLRLAECSDRAEDVEDLELRDGMRLAVVVKADEFTLVDQQVAATLTGWQQGRIAGGEFKAAEWATAKLAGDKGATRWCFKIVVGRIGGAIVTIEIDGMAYSVLRVVLVELKPRITLQHVEELADKMQNLKRLVKSGAPNTAMLRNPATGQIKTLEVYLMADLWVDNPDEVAACTTRMEEYGIQPVLPTGDGYTVGDSCGRWPPPDDSTQQRGQNFLAKLQRQPQSGGAGSDAGAGMGGGAESLNSTAAIRPRPSPAACSPAPACHLRTHPLSAAAWVQRRVVSVCRPMHLPRQHASSGPSVRRL